MKLSNYDIKACVLAHISLRLLSLAGLDAKVIFAKIFCAIELLLASGAKLVKQNVNFARIQLSYGRYSIVADM